MPKPSPKARPTSAGRLNRRIQKIAGNDADKAERTARVLSYAVAGQMMPPGVIKGGAGMRLRYGSAATRFSTDLDGAWQVGLDDFIREFGANLRAGWQGFTGTLAAVEREIPKAVPAEYAMRKFEIALHYEGDDWRTVDFELTHNEIGDADEGERVLAPEIAEQFAQLGFDEPRPLALIIPEYQVAQKIHAASAPGSRRAHDLVDLQVMAQREELDLPLLRSLCVRLFAYRKRHPWPPEVTVGKGWGTLYDSAANGIDVAMCVEDAVDWANQLVKEIDAAK